VEVTTRNKYIKVAANIVNIGEKVEDIFTGYRHLTTTAVFCLLSACGQFTGSELNKEGSYPLSKCELVAANHLSFKKV
jgi:hypothetical protein